MKTNIFFILFWHHFSFPKRVICFLSFVSEQLGVQSKFIFFRIEAHTTKFLGELKADCQLIPFPSSPNFLLLKRATVPTLFHFSETVYINDGPIWAELGERYKDLCYPSDTTLHSHPSFSAPHWGSLVCWLHSPNSLSAHYTSLSPPQELIPRALLSKLPEYKSLPRSLLSREPDMTFSFSKMRIE